LIKKALRESAVDLFSDAAVYAVNQIIDSCSIRQGDLPKIAEHVIIVLGDGASIGFGTQFTVSGVEITGTVVSAQSILIIVAGDEDIIKMGTVTVAVVLVALSRCAVLCDISELPCCVVGITIDCSNTVDRFSLLTDATQIISNVADTVQAAGAAALQFAEAVVAATGGDTAQCGAGQQTILCITA